MIELRPDDAHLSDWQRTRCYATAVRRADRALNRIYDNALRSTGLTTAQFSLLSLIDRAPIDITISDLAQAQVMDRTTLSRNLEPLVSAGMISIALGEDRRQRMVMLTELGKEAISSIRPVWKQVQENLEEENGTARMAELLAELGALVGNIQQVKHG